MASADELGIRRYHDAGLYRHCSLSLCSLCAWLALPKQSFEGHVTLLRTHRSIIAQRSRGLTCRAVTEWTGLASMRNTCQKAVTLSQAGDTVSGPYFRITGCTGAPARNAPVLNGNMYFPFVVVPCRRNSDSAPFTWAALLAAACANVCLASISRFAHFTNNA